MKKSRLFLVTLVLSLVLTFISFAGSAPLITSFVKIDESKSVYTLPGPVSFLIIKQATAAIVWTPTPLDDTQKAQLIGESQGYDKSLIKCTFYFTTSTTINISDTPPLDGTYVLNTSTWTLTCDPEKISHLDYGCFSKCTPTPTPTCTPTPTPTCTPTPTPTCTPTPTPTCTPTPTPDVTPTPTPDVTQTPCPTATHDINPPTSDNIPVNPLRVIGLLGAVASLAAYIWLRRI